MYTYKTVVFLLQQQEVISRVDFTDAKAEYSGFTVTLQNLLH